jgi:hypothetical protein
MRVLNGVLVVVWGVGGIVTLGNSLVDPWSLAGSLLGVIMWTAPYYYAWRAFGPTATLKVVRAARRWNIGILIAMGVLGCASVALTIVDPSASWLGFLPVMLAVLLIAVPPVLNIRALRSRMFEQLTGISLISLTSQPREQVPVSQ